MTAFFAGIVLLISLPFLWIVARRPVLRRLAVRNAVRRPREALLVVIGSMLGAAIITGSFVVGDAMNASIRQQARAHLGPVDELVVARDRSAWEELAAKLERVTRRDVDGVLPIATMEAGVTSSAHGRLLAAPRSKVIGLDFAAARRFGGHAGDTGIRGAAPNEGHAAINADLARILQVGVGDAIDVYAYGTRTMLFVDAILPGKGLAGFSVGFQQDAPNVLVPLSAFDGIRGISSAYAAPPLWSVLVSNTGGVESGAGRTDAASAAIREAARPLSPQILNVKETVLDQAKATGDGFGQMFTAMGSFGVLAGLLLLVNLFVMLAAERKPEMGMARAVGMRRGALVGAFATEGWFYAVLATALGTVTGVGLGRLLIALSERAFNTQHYKFDLAFVVKPSSLAEAFAIGFGISLVTILATSVRVSRLNIIRAIREIAEPPTRRRRRWIVAGSLAVALGLVWSASAFAGKEPFGILLGPSLLLLGLAPLARRKSRRSTPLSVLAAAAVVWGAAALVVIPDATDGAPVTLFVAQGIVLTASAVALAALQQERLGGIVRHLGRHTIALRLGFAYPLARPSRTALTVAMYGLVVFILTFITTLSHLIDTDAAQGTAKVQGAYQVLVSSSASNPIGPATLAAVRGVRAVAPLGRTSARFQTRSMSESALWDLTAFGPAFVEHGPPRLEDRGTYPTDAAAWKAVLRDPSLVIVDPTFLQTAGGPANFNGKVGARIALSDPYSGRRRVVTVAAISPSDMYIQSGAFYGLAGARQMFRERLTPTRFYVQLDRGVDADTFASTVQSRFVDNGTEATSIKRLMDEAYTMSHQIFQLFQGYLALGLLVGIAGIAVVMIRAVRERRRQIGTLRAIGFSSRTVGRSFAIETGFIALEGTVIGASLGLLTLYTLVTRSDAMGTAAFSVPWLPLAALLIGTIVASLLATLAPAVSATRIRPAVALRMTD